MKHARVNQILSGAAAVIALSVGASAQLVTREDGALAGRPTRTVVLEDGLRTRELTLVFKMRPRAGTDPLAVMPLAEEMIRTLELSNGTPGGVAVIHLGTHELELRNGGAGRVRIAGLFDEDGVFSYELPQGADVRGLFAMGEDVLDLGIHQLVKKSAGGGAVPDSKRPEMDIEEHQVIERKLKNRQLATKSAGGAAVPDSKRPEMDIEEHQVVERKLKNRQLATKSAGGAAVPDSKRPEMDIEEHQVVERKLKNRQLATKSAGGAAVPDSKRPEMDIEEHQVIERKLKNRQLATKSAGGAAVPDSKRPEMDIEEHQVIERKLKNRQLVTKSAGGAAVPDSKRPEMDIEEHVVDLEEESEITYAKWWKLWTKLQLGNDHRAR